MAKKPAPGFTSPGISAPKGPDYVVVELRHDSQVGFSTKGFMGTAAAEPSTGELNGILSQYHVRSIAPLFDVTDKKVRRRVSEAPPTLDVPVDADFAHSGFVRVMPRKKADIPKLIRRLNKATSVWKAELAPRPVPAAEPTGSSTTSRNFEPCQGYLASAPDGIGAVDAWQKYGARGAGVTICDIEGNWNFTHEDLPTIRHIGGTLLNNIKWINHGTAVLGEMVSKPGRSGTVGISHKARAYVQSAMIGGVWNAAGAIANAASRLRRGDVILIELQAEGPNGKYVAMQYWDPIFSAIRAAVQKGICVVEAAGNGNENFQLPIFRNTGLQKDAGAIVVGAGVPPTNYFDNFGNAWGFTSYGRIGNPRSRIWFSNYGDIVNVQGWGWHVTTTGYGDAQGGPNQNRWYTHRFSGTSSASPIVTGAVACIQSRAKARHGHPLSPARVRSILVQTGTPQVSGPGVPLRQRIGPQPNLMRALARV